MNEMKVLSENEEMRVNGGFIPLAPIVLKAAISIAKTIVVRTAVSAYVGKKIGDFGNKVMGWDKKSTKR